MKTRTDNHRKVLLRYLVVLGGLAAACGEDDENGVSVIGDRIFYNNVQLLGTNVQPPVATGGSGLMNATYYDATNRLEYSVTWRLGNPNANTISISFHGPAGVNSSAPSIISVKGFKPDHNGTVMGTTRALTQEEENDLKTGRWYVSVQSTTYPEGELRGNLLRD